jgi:lactate dehydrogenase-like 2-hydroxyacid dehydrogenase
VLTLVRKLHRAVSRIREGNFSLEGLLGFELHGRTIGVVGTGRIGETMIRLLSGFGAKLLAYDPVQSPACLALGARYVPLGELLAESDVVLQDDVFARLLTFPNVVITGHEAFFTEEAPTAIARTTLGSASDFEAGRSLDPEARVA